METIHKIKVTNKDKVVAVKFKHPELMHPGADKAVVEEYHRLLYKDKELHLARERVRQLEKEYSSLEKEWASKSEMFELEFETTEKEVKTEKSFLTINGDLVYTYKH